MSSPKNLPPSRCKKLIWVFSGWPLLACVLLSRFAPFSLWIAIPVSFNAQFPYWLENLSGDEHLDEWHCAYEGIAWGWTAWVARSG